MLSLQRNYEMCVVFFVLFCLFVCLFFYVYMELLGRVEPLRGNYTPDQKLAFFFFFWKMIYASYSKMSTELKEST